MVGRAGVGVDNVDVPTPPPSAASSSPTRRSRTSITAAEHTMALLLALARNVPQAHASLTGGAWERSKFSGVELYEKTLGILGLRPHRPARRAAGARVRDARDRLRPVRRAPSATASSASRRPSRSDDVYARRRLHHAAPAEDARDRGLARRRGARQDARTACGSSTSPAATAGRRRGPQGGARLRQGRRRGARRVPVRADHRPPAVRLPERRRHAAPRRLDRRGAPTAPATRPPSRWSPR